MPWIAASQPLIDHLSRGRLIADMQQAQLMMVAGFIMLGWVLARRQIKMRKRVNRDARAANQAIQKIRDHKDPSVPLCNAPPETQRWQAAMFDLQRRIESRVGHANCRRADAAAARGPADPTARSSRRDVGPHRGSRLPHLRRPATRCATVAQERTHSTGNCSADGITDRRRRTDHFDAAISLDSETK